VAVQAFEVEVAADVHVNPVGKDACALNVGVGAADDV